MMKNTTLSITGMTCDHCKAAVERALKKVPGVTSVTVDRMANRAEIEWDESKSPRDAFIATVTELGYTAK